MQTFKVTRWFRKDVLLFDNDDENKKKYTKFHFTEGFVHKKSSPFSLQVVNIHPEFTHIDILSKYSYSGVDTLNLKLFNVGSKKYAYIESASP